MYLEQKALKASYTNKNTMKNLLILLIVVACFLGCEKQQIESCYSDFSCRIESNYNGSFGGMKGSYLCEDVKVYEKYGGLLTDRTINLLLHVEEGCLYVGNFECDNYYQYGNCFALLNLPLDSIVVENESNEAYLLSVSGYVFGDDKYGRGWFVRQ